MRAQHPRTDCVEGSTPHPLEVASAFGRITTYKRSYSLAHFSGGLVGESHRENTRGVYSVMLDETRDARGEDASLPRAGAGDDQQGTFTIEKVQGMRPYTPLEQAGRDIYVREGCYVCHSQMIRPLRDEVERYGHYSLAAESMYDHPFQWGSKRTGPDLARVGGKYSDSWHVDHMR